MGTDDIAARTVTQPLFRPRSLRFLLPLEPGERLAVVGDWPDIARSAAKTGAATVSVLSAPPADGEEGPGEVVRTDGESVPLPDGACDHVMLPCLRPGLAGLVPAELRRIVRPGGTVLLGAPWRVRAPRSPSAVTVGSGRRLLRAAGFTDVRAFGVAPSLRQPRHVVPVEAGNALRWYMEAGYQPSGTRGVVAARALRWAPGRLALLAFRDLAFVGTRPARPGAA